METQENKNKILKPLLVGLLAILLIAGTGLGVWWWQNGELNKQKTDSDKQVSELQKQLRVLKSESEKTKQMGTIKGSLSYPSEGIPALTVCAMEAGSKKETCIKTKENDTSYEIKVDPGTYHILARSEAATAFYTNCDSTQKPAVCNNESWHQSNFTCSSDMACKEAFTIPKIEVTARQTIKDINISNGWYLPCSSTECVNGQDNPKRWDNYMNCD